MQNEKKIVANTETGITTQHNEVLKKETLLKKKKENLSEQVINLFTLTDPVDFITHLSFLQEFFIQNHKKSDWSKKDIATSISFTNEIKSSIVKQYQIFRDIDKIENSIELLTIKK